MDQYVKELGDVFSLISQTNFPTIFVTVGLLLIALSAYYSFKAIGKKPEEFLLYQRVLLFITLFAGVFSIGLGASAALLHVFDNPIKQVAASEAFENLRDNRRIDWLIRLIPFSPSTENYLSIAELKTIGPTDAQYVFVGSYHELKGRTVQKAVEMLGGSVDPGQRVSAIIFRLRKIFPANARGLLQVVAKIDSGINEPNAKKLNLNNLEPAEQSDLTKEDLPSWAWSSYSRYYEGYCKIAMRFRCSEPPYSARKFMSALSRDWHPIGISRINQTDLCNDPGGTCKVDSWEDARKKLLPEFGARVFFMQNYQLNALGDRYLIDFGEPDKQIIPEIGGGS